MLHRLKPTNLTAEPMDERLPDQDGLNYSQISHFSIVNRNIKN